MLVVEGTAPAREAVAQACAPWPTATGTGTGAGRDGPVEPAGLAGVDGFAGDDDPRGVAEGEGLAGAGGRTGPAVTPVPMAADGDGAAALPPSVSADGVPEESPSKGWGAWDAVVAGVARVDPDGVGRAEF